MKKIILSFILVLSTILQAKLMNVELSGEWKLQLDAEDVMLGNPTEQWDFPDSMKLPGTTDLAKKGTHVTQAIPFNYHLNREYTYTGAAYYSREIIIPEDWKGFSTELFLERVMWQSRVWVDGKEASKPQDSLNTPHHHNLGSLTPGKHKLIIRVDNRMIHPIGDKGHAYGDQTQSIWNGIVGKIELRAIAANHLELVRVFPSNDGSLKVEVTGTGRGTWELKAICHDGKSGRSFSSAIKAAGKFTTVIEGRVNKPQIWSEFNPKTYQLQVDLCQNGKVIDTKTTTFGFREVSREGNKLLINGQPAFMRGNLECAVFPLTGHPPVTVDGWRKVWQVYQDHNLNHARFHSWCPPEAAFIAADEMGIYLQVEAPIWMDRWMTKPNPRKEMDTLGYPQGLGKNDRTTDAFALAEIRRTIDTYGNHPSFVFFSIGNELGTSNFDVTGTWMRDAKKHDPRHLYAASTARTITPFCDFNATHNIPGIGGTRQKVSFGTDWDYEHTYGKASVPIIAHEIGQWPVYVDWKSELPKYTGPLKPYRLQAMAEQAKKNGLYDRSEQLKLASGASNRILYRDEIESFLRTPSCRGFQLLGMQDFSGQGEALIGWLDSFYESKGTTDPATFRRYCAPTVPLLKLPGYVFQSGDRPEIEALLHHYGPNDLTNTKLVWKLTDGDHILGSGMLTTRDYPSGSVTPSGKFTLDFSKLKGRAAQLKLTIGVPAEKITNDYDLWVYPAGTDPAPPRNILLTDDWAAEAKAALEKGESVLLMAHGLGGRRASRLASWIPLYWSVPFFPGQNRETIGLFVDAEHKAFAKFPTSSYGDWNWFRLCRGAHGFDLTSNKENSFQPIAEPVTDFHLNRRLGSIFEARVGKGKLLVCGYDISEARSKVLPEAAQLRHSLLDYVASSHFQPKAEIKISELEKMLADPDLKLQKIEPRFEKADLYVNAAGELRKLGQSIPWAQAHDQVLRRSEGVDYAVQADGIWRDQVGSAWHGKKLVIKVKPRSGVPGKFLFRVHDWNKNGRTGKVVFEGKESDLGVHTEGGWIEFPVIREDTNDGELILTVNTITGPNIMITDIVFVPEE